MSKINKEQKRKLKKQLRKLQKSFCKINTILSQDCGGVYIEVNKKFDRMYPFDKSFDEMTLEVDEWIEDMYPSLKIIKGTAIYTGGGIYIIIGKLNDGNIIISSNQGWDILNPNKTNNDDEFIARWDDVSWILDNMYVEIYEKYEVNNDYQDRDVLRAIKKFCKDLDKGKGDLYLIDEFRGTGNYSSGELKRMIYDNLKENW